VRVVHTPARFLGWTGCGRRPAPTPAGARGPRRC